MTSTEPRLETYRPSHAWLRKVHLTHLTGPTTPMLERVIKQLLDHFRQRGHTLQEMPNEQTDIILTTAQFGVPIGWREALLFTARRKYGLEHNPTIFTLLHITPQQFNQSLEYFRLALAKEPPDPTDFSLPGLAPQAYRTLYEQGRRGGPILALMRAIQTQTMSIRVILVVGEEEPVEAYNFDLVGAYPRSDAANLDAFYEDLVLRMTTAVSTGEITKHKLVGELISAGVWKKLNTPEAMRYAGIELGKRYFFTEMVRIADLAHVPAIDEAVSSQYSEGCFATWDPEIKALISTITGSARPVDKDRLTDNELAVIVGIRPDGMGALVNHVEGKRNDPPSSEAFELIEMDGPLPNVKVVLSLDGVVLEDGNEESGIIYDAVPVARSKLHGHRGVRAYNPRYVEHVSLDEPFYHYPVSCSTEAQARAIKTAFSRSEAFNHPEDQRQVVFTVLPGHGIVIAEKWVPGKKPFQIMWEYMDANILQIHNHVPQGQLSFIPAEGEVRVIKTT